MKIPPLRWLAFPAALWLATGIASAQSVAAATPTAEAPTRITEYKSVADAKAALEAEDGQSTIVTHPEGWVIVNQPAAAAQWSFTPPEHVAYPAVVRRIIRRGPDRAVKVETSSLCEAPATACTQLLVEFAAMNERITQARQGRGAPPPAPGASTAR
jgi:hypothetical protein